MKYPVLWWNIWTHLTKYMSLAISIPVIFVFIIRFLKNDMSLEKTFEHISLFQLPLLFIGIVVFSSIFAFIFSLLINAAAVEVRDGKLIGRNYWYFSKSIPISSITQLYRFSNNGIDAIVADAGVFGKVYISIHTDRLNELIQYIEQNSSIGNA